MSKLSNTVSQLLIPQCYLTQPINIFVKRRKCQLPTYYQTEAKHGPKQRVELKLYTIKLSGKKNIGATSYKIKNESINPTFPTVQM